MISGKNNMSNKKSELLLGLDNWNDFNVAFKNFSIGYGDAGKMLISNTKPNLDDPDFDDVDHNASRIYDDQAPHGREMWIDDRRAMQKKRAKFDDDNQSLLAKLLMSLSDDVSNILRAEPTYSKLYGDQDLLAIYLLLQQQGITQGAGVHHITAASLAFLTLHQIDPSTGIRLLTYEQYVLKFRQNLSELNSLCTHHVDDALATSSFLLSLDGSDCTEELKLLLGMTTLPTVEDAIKRITAAKRVTRTVTGMLSKSAKPTGKRVESIPTDKNLMKEDVTANKVKIKTDYNAKHGVSWTCFNCGVLDPAHGKGHCDKPKEICGTCNKPWHKTSCHETWVASRPSKVEKGKLARVTPESSSSHTVYMARVTGSEMKSSGSDRFVPDTACTRTLCNKTEHLDNLIPLRSHQTKVEGFSDGDPCYATHGGTIIGGLPAICVAEAVDNLFSLPDVADAGGSFYGDADGLTVFRSTKTFDKKSDVMVEFPRDSDGLWSCAASQITHKANISIVENHFSAEERKRALAYRQLHETLGHPSDDTLTSGLRNGVLLNCDLTTNDAMNAKRLFGECKACLIGKMTAPEVPSSTSAPASEIGDVVHVDPVDYEEVTIGGNKACLVTMDEKSDFVVAYNLKHSTADHISTALTGIISVYNSHRHQVQKIVSDHGSNLVASAVNMGLLGVQMGTTIPGQHAKRIERKIRTIKSRERAVLASLPYKLPAKLHGELRANVITTINMLPTANSSGRSPMELFTGVKPDLRMLCRAPFGTPAIFYRPDQPNGLEPRAEYGIIVGWHKGTKNGVRAYFPGRNLVLIRQKYTVIDAIPPEWGWKVQVASRVNSRPPVPLSNTLVQSTVQAYVEEYNSVLEDNYASSFVTPINTTLVPQVNTFDQESVPPSVDVTSDEPNINNTITVPNLLDIPASDSTPELTSLADKDIIMEDSDNAADIIIPSIETSVKDEIEGELRRSTRNRNSFVGSGNSTNNEYSKFQARITVHCDRILHEMEANEAISREFKCLREEMEAVVPIAFTSIDTLHGDSIIPSHMLVNDKYTPDGEYDKTKARLCAGGNWLDPEACGDTASKTVNGITSSVILKIAAARDEEIGVYDIKSAYLHARKEPGTSRIVIKLAPDMSRLYVELYPESRALLHEGCLYLELLAYLYGLPQAALMFQLHLTKFLIDLGYKQCTMDECLYVKYVDCNNYSRIAVHVDDMLVTGKGMTLIDELNKALGTAFVGYTCQRSNKMSYLGQTITRERSNHVLKLSLFAQITELLERMGMTDANGEDMPYGTNFLVDDPSSPLINRNEYLSVVMALLYMSQKSRYDIYFATVYLATKSQPTVKDWEAAKRVLRYLIFTKDYELTFSGTDLTVSLLADASHALHLDLKGHSGIEVLIGGNIVYCQSGKQKANTISSTESEVLCLRDAVTYVPYLITLFEELSLPIQYPIVIGQDNTAVIEWTTHGAKFKRATHVLVAIHFVKDFIDKGLVVLQHVPTTVMHPDMLTKPVPASIFKPFVMQMFTSRSSR